MSPKEPEFSGIAVTVDLDWACEPAIEYTLGYLDKNKIPYTVFTTHNSKQSKKIKWHRGWVASFFSSGVISWCWN